MVIGLVLLVKTISAGVKKGVQLRSTLLVTFNQWLI